MSGKLTPQPENKPVRPPGQGLDGLGLFEELTTSEHIKDKEIKDNFWAGFSPNRILAYLPDVEIQKGKIDFMVKKIDFLETIPQHAYTAELSVRLEHSETEWTNGLYRGLQGFTFKGVIKMMKVTSDLPTDKPDANNAGFLSGPKKAISKLFG